MERNWSRSEQKTEKSINTHMEENTNNRTNKCLISLKVLIGVLCLLGFFFNSFIIFKQFIGKETVTSSKVQENTELYLPSLTLCGFSGFKSSVNNYSDLELVKYVNNTVDLDEILIEVIDRDEMTLKAVTLLDTMYDKSGRWKISTTYSAYRGRCYTIEYSRMV